MRPDNDHTIQIQFNGDGETFVIKGLTEAKLPKYKREILTTLIIQLDGTIVTETPEKIVAVGLKGKISLNSGLSSYNSLARKLAFSIPDPGERIITEWQSNPTLFSGPATKIIEEDTFRVLFLDGVKNIKNLAALPYDQALVKNLGKKELFNANWVIVGRVDGRDSVDDLKDRYPKAETFKEVYWPTTFEYDYGRSRPNLDPLSMRVEVKSVSGTEIEKNAFIRSEKGRWGVIRYVRKESGWERTFVDERGDPLIIRCMRCQGYRDNFGPTPKMENFKNPPRGWFSYVVPVPYFNSDGQIRFKNETQIPEFSYGNVIRQD